ncbi:FmdB family zinc ribbon protein [Kocuria sp. APC 4018]|uniref:FmdB family zinc ribbon protein n=1 Tax=Kocuria TaxID=57493 RepID=UPI0025B58570|nr:FmdB family zinc ribbon protein [Kocuria sp. APC 4018]MDN3461523.1 zinc ribbon domain-containing protein [Kocuria sp. APC 4018]WSY87339.1 FmdB family transcriptional regulator [Kocuria rhizophila]WSZ52763.1 FmdB family transcriptional regulator [Kocuria rhizophila]
MPVYAYACKDCGHAFDIRQSFSDDALTVCPECGGVLRKKFNSVGVVFKGSGFYRTDSRSGASGDAGTASASGSAGGSGSPGGSGSSGDSAATGSGSGSSGNAASTPSVPSTTGSGSGTTTSGGSATSR